MVIAILIALSAVLVPSIGQLIARQDMAKVKDELLDAIDLAHSQAIASGAPYTVTVTAVDANLNGSVVVREGEVWQTCAQVAADGAVIRRVQLAPEDAQIDTGATPGQVSPRVIPTGVRITSIAPDSFKNGRAMCFKGDGSMRDPELNTPVPNPDNTAPFTGDVLIRFQEYRGGDPRGVLNYVVVSYNGVARARF